MTHSSLLHEVNGILSRRKAENGEHPIWKFPR